MNQERTQSQRRDGTVATILSEESFLPPEPSDLSETGLPVSMIESLLCKQLSLVGQATGRQLAKRLCLPFKLLSSLLMSLRERQIIVHKGSAPLNDYIYELTERGRERARVALAACAYVGPAPVPLVDYVLSAEAQSIRFEAPRREHLKRAFRDIAVDEALFEALGPAVNSGAGLFLYGEPGNGKSTLAKRITNCFGQQIWIPHAIIEDSQIIKLYDPSLHTVDADSAASLDSISYDQRWLKIRRPTVVVGGELTMDGLEIRHDAQSNISEAPLQMKSNCGCFLIDDFGRQRIEPRELLNRWIVPLESRFDFLTLSTGKKVQVPFEQLIIFSTNLEPSDLVDEAFLRRIPYKIHVKDPDESEFHLLFEIYARTFNCEYRPDVVDYLLQHHYQAAGRPLRRCHPRDLLAQIRNYCVYNDLPIEMCDEYFDRVVKNYFAFTLKPVRCPPSPTATSETAGPRDVPAGRGQAAAVRQRPANRITPNSPGHGQPPSTAAQEEAAKTASPRQPPQTAAPAVAAKVRPSAPTSRQPQRASAPAAGPVSPASKPIVTPGPAVAEPGMRRPGATPGPDSSP